MLSTKTPALRSFAAAFAFAAVLALPGCKTVEFGTGATTPGDTTTAVGKLSVTNMIDKDPAKLNMRLYGSGVQSIEDATPVRTLGDVDTGKTVEFTVPAGTYKIGYSTDAKVQAMPADTLVGGSQDWPTVTIKKGSTHFIKMYTDVGGNEVWLSDFFN